MELNNNLNPLPLVVANFWVNIIFILNVEILENFARKLGSFTFLLSTLGIAGF